MSKCPTGLVSAEIVGVNILRRHVEYEIEVFVDGRSVWTVERRFTHFRLLHEDLLRCKLKPLLVSLPRKTFFGNFDSSFLEARRTALQDYLDEVFRAHAGNLPQCVGEFLGWTSNYISGQHLRAPRRTPPTSYDFCESTVHCSQTSSGTCCGTEGTLDHSYAEELNDLFDDFDAKLNALPDVPLPHNQGRMNLQFDDRALLQMACCSV